MFLKNVMTPQVEEISPEQTLRDAASKMKSLDIGALAVVDDGHVVGMITDRDIAIRATSRGRGPESPVRSAMTPKVVYCHEDDDVDIAATVMRQEQIRRLLVFDRDEQPVGIVSLGDLATRTHDEYLCGRVLQCVSESI